MTPDASASFPLPFPLDLDLTLGPLQRGPSDPTIRFGLDGIWRAARTPAAPATVWLQHGGSQLIADAWGVGASWLGCHASSLLGFDDRPVSLKPANLLLRDLPRHLPRPPLA